MRKDRAAHSGVSERIKLARTRLGLSQAEFASRLGVNRAHISRIESGQAIPPEHLLRLIAYEYSMSNVWLKRGKGKMELDVAEAMARERDVALSAYETQLAIFFKISSLLVPDIISGLELFAEEEGWDSLPAGIRGTLLAIKERLELGKVPLLIEKLLSRSDPLKREDQDGTVTFDVDV